MSLLGDPRPDSAFDAECVSCHTTGFPYVSGWRSEAATPYLAGNQCENCHGPGSKHAADPDNALLRHAMSRPNEHDRKTLCYRCHDNDNSPDFDFTRYWAKIAHKSLDDYSDPKVHHGVTARPDGRPSIAGNP
jgi:Cytochrome c554 and c-prime